MTGAGKEGGVSSEQVWTDLEGGMGWARGWGGEVEQVGEAWAGNRGYTSQLLYNVVSQATLTKFVFFRGGGQSKLLSGVK